MHCLIVEDDPHMCFALAEMVEELGHTHCTAPTVSDGIKHLRTKKFDIILLDYQLPDGTSTDLSTMAAVTQPNCRIIMVTGTTAFPAGEHGQLAPGVDWILRKPASFDDLTALIAYAERDAEWHPTPVHSYR